MKYLFIAAFLFFEVSVVFGQATVTDPGLAAIMTTLGLDQKTAFAKDLAQAYATYKEIVNTLNVATNTYEKTVQTYNTLKDTYENAKQNLQAFKDANANFSAKDLSSLTSSINAISQSILDMENTFNQAMVIKFADGTSLDFTDLKGTVEAQLARGKAIMQLTPDDPEFYHFYRTIGFNDSTFKLSAQVTKIVWAMDKSASLMEAKQKALIKEQNDLMTALHSKEGFDINSLKEGKDPKASSAQIQAVIQMVNEEMLNSINQGNLANSMARQREALSRLNEANIKAAEEANAKMAEIFKIVPLQETANENVPIDGTGSDVLGGIN